MIKLIENAITQELADRLIDICNKNLKKLTTRGNIEYYRIADGHGFDLDSDISKEVSEIISMHSGCPSENFERIQVVRYDLYGRYNEHYDCFEESDPLYEKEMIEGGQRLKSALIYLNDDFEGGQTYFNNIGRMITPKKLMMIIWDNLLEDGSLDPDSLHTGVIVDSGVKYIALTFIRQREHRKFLL